MRNSFGEERLKATFGVDLNEAVDTTQSGVTLYVNREFSGKAGVTVSASGLTTANSSYAAQWNSAVVGNPAKPFPCIWSAQLVAKQLVAATGRTVIIRVFAGNTYTIGSPTLLQNGDSNANPAINEEADIQVANVAADLFAASLGQKNIVYQFDEDVILISICKSYAIRLVYLNDSSERWVTKILGKGEFRWLYGEAEGVGNSILETKNIPDLHLTFQGHKALVNQWRGLWINEFQYVNIDFDKYYDADPAFFWVRSTDDWKTNGRTEPKCYIDIRDRRHGRGLFTGLPAIASDFGSNHSFFAKYGAFYSIRFDTYSANTTYGGDGVFLRFTDTSRTTDNTIVFNINRMALSVVDAGGAVNIAGDARMIRCSPTSNDSTLFANNHIVINVHSAKSMFAFGESSGGSLMLRLSKSSYTLNVTGVWENPSSAMPVVYLESNAQSTEDGNQIIVKGNFVATGGAPVVKTGAVGGLTTLPNAQAYQFKSCELVQKVAGKPAVDLGNAFTNFNVFFDNCKIVNDGAAEVISKSATNAPMNVFCSNVWTNGGPVSANVSVDGDALKTNARIVNILNR